MGREITAEIRETLADFNDKNFDYDKDTRVLWQSEGWVCGRDSATNYICLCTDRSGVYACLEGGNLKRIQEEIQEYAQKDRDEIRRVKSRLEGLLAARKNARNYAEFSSFDEPIDECQEWLKQESFSRAEALLALIDEVLQEYKSGKYDTKKCDPYLVVSE